MKDEIGDSYLLDKTEEHGEREIEERERGRSLLCLRKCTSLKRQPISQYILSEREGEERRERERGL